MNFEARYLKMEVCGQLLTHWTIYPQKKILHNPLTIVLVGPRAALDPSEKRIGKNVKPVCGSYSTAALWHILLLPERVPSFISRGAAHTKRRERFC
jgi:hypothetical protein